MKIRLPRTRRYRVYIYVVCGVLVGLAVDLVWVRVWRRVEIGERTTGITSPLKEDGMPDYFRFIDERQREGVTAENNAAAVFIEAVSPMRSDPQTGKMVVWREMYEKLGMAVPGEAREQVSIYAMGRKLVPEREHWDDPKVDEEAAFVLNNPWKAVEHPLAAAWLKANERALGLVPAMVARGRWYMPMVRPKDGLLISTLLPSLGPVRELSNEVIARAMLEIQEGKFAEAQEDILAVHKLARLQAQGWTLIEYMVGVGMDEMALEADSVLAASPGLSREQLGKFVEEWDALPAWPGITSKMDTERYGALDCLVFAAGHPAEGAQLFVSIMGEAKEAPVMPAWVERELRPAHFNAALAEANETFDKFANAARGATAVEREDAAKAAEKEFQAYAEPLMGRFADPARRMVAEIVPSIVSALKVHDRREMNAGLARVALAMAMYRVEKGGYPETLGELAPTYMKVVPGDCFSGGALHYQKTSEGYVVYSVGDDRVDDGGKVRNIAQGGYKGDLVVRVPR